MFIIKKLSLSMFMLIFLFFTGCATKNLYSNMFVGQIEKIETVNDAIHIFGTPDVEMLQGDGLLRHSWIIHESSFVDGHYKKVYHSSSFGSSASYYELVYVPAKETRDYCFFNIYTADEGDIINMTWEGNSCDSLLQRNLGGDRHNGLPQTK